MEIKRHGRILNYHINQKKTHKKWTKQEPSLNIVFLLKMVKMWEVISLAASDVSRNVMTLWICSRITKHASLENCLNKPVEPALQLAFCLTCFWRNKISRLNITLNDPSRQIAFAEREKEKNDSHFQATPTVFFVYIYIYTKS